MLAWADYTDGNPQPKLWPTTENPKTKKQKQKNNNKKQENPMGKKNLLMMQNNDARQIKTENISRR